MNTNFIYFSTGNPVLHRRTIFSILSLRAFYSFEKGDNIFVFTDNPDFYREFLKDLPLEYVLIEEKDIRRMMGRDDLIHRVKIGIIEQIALRFPKDKILYVDSDTFFIQNIHSLLAQISPEVALMHLNEGNIGHFAQPGADLTARKFYELLTEGRVNLNKKPLDISPENFISWNAGVIGLDPKHFAWFGEVYELTDQFYAYSRSHASEQYAFAYILQARTRLAPCEAYIQHYWHSVEKKITDEYLEKLLNQSFLKLSETNKQEKIRKHIQKFLNYYQGHPYKLSYLTMISFSEKQYLRAYVFAARTLLKNPLQPLKFFKDVAYYTKRMLFGR